MNIGIIASSNGSVFKSLYDSLILIYPDSFTFFVLLDRDSTLIDFCIQRKIQYKMIQEIDNRQFSKVADEFFYSKNVQYIFLFFLRMVTKELYDNYSVFNIHPSLLPKYKGLNAIKNALQDRQKDLGATLHRVDKSLDGGEIVFQIKSNISKEISFSRACKLSYIQKTYLMFVIFERLAMMRLSEDFKDMTLNDNSELYKKITLIQHTENCWIFDE